MATHLSLAKPLDWKGVWTALITPLKKTGTTLALDHDSLMRMIESQIAGGVRGLVIAGSTGEGSLLNDALFEELLRAAFEFTKHRIPLMAGVGINGTESALKKAALIKQLGYQAVLASPPAYIKTPQRGLVKHFLDIASVGLPVCLYEVASRAASSINVETIDELVKSSHAAAKNIVAIKDASASLERALRTRAVVGDKIAMLSGDDGTYQPFLAAGGVGVISVVSHLVPKSMNKILELMEQQKNVLAADLQTRMLPLIDAMFCEANPIPVKSALHALGKISADTISEPLVPLRADFLEKVLKTYKDFGAEI